MKIILDTNVLISGIFFSGLPNQILNAWRHGKFKIVLSQEIVDEYLAVAERISSKYDGIDIERILELIITRSEIGQTLSSQPVEKASARRHRGCVRRSTQVRPL